jgi:hypothetical protein
MTAIGAQAEIVSSIGAADSFPPEARTILLARRSRRFIHIALFTALILQRFGLNLGESVVFASTPVFALALAWMLWRRQARVRPGALFLYALVAALFLTSALVAILYPDPRVKNSLPSLFAILALYAMLTIEPNERFDKGHSIDIFLAYARVLAALGILQFAVQFVGVRIFAFSTTLPFLRPVLVEHIYAWNPVLGWRSTIVRSNGFFLVEPATFSQLLVVAIAIDFFVRRTFKFLPLYLTAYLVSFSGTGLLALTTALAIYALTSFANMRRTLSFATLAALAVSMVALAVPAVFDVFARRAHELQSTGSSGYARYVAQFSTVQAFLHEARSLIGYGPGAFERSHYYVEGSGSPAVKLFVDYGVFGLTLFAVFLPYTMLRSSRHLILPILLLVDFQLGGGHLLFAPLIVLMSVLCIWSDPEPGLGARSTQRSCARAG